MSEIDLQIVHKIRHRESSYGSAIEEQKTDHDNLVIRIPGQYVVLFRWDGETWRGHDSIPEYQLVSIEIEDQNADN